MTDTDIERQIESNDPDTVSVPKLVHAAEEIRIGPPTTGTALCLSGGGYRAMLFHLGTLWRLNEFGYLPRLDRISSVSGGSITAGVLAAGWSGLSFNQNGVAQEFQRQVVEPVRLIAGKTIDLPAILKGFILPGGAGKRVANAYRKILFGDATLQSLPERPTFVINATNMQSGVLWRFRKDFARDYRVGEIKHPTFLLAEAVAASSAFPPLLSPIVLKLAASAYSPRTDEDLHFPPFTTRVVLADGGVYDNLGLETAWKDCQTILVSDAGGNLKPAGSLSRFWFSQVIRTLLVINNQVRSLRTRNLIEAYVAKSRLGAYWGIRTDILHYGLADALVCPVTATAVLANVATRLKHLPVLTQERLINWGYAVCDAGMRKHVDKTLPAPKQFPYPQAGVG